MEMEKQMFGKQMFAGPAQMMGLRVDPDLQALPSFPQHTEPMFFTDISGENSILGTGPLPKFFRQLTEGDG